MRTVIYCRISKDKAGKALGVERQRDDCLRLAALRGWEVAPDDMIVDNDLGASRNSRKPRPGFDRLKQMVEAGEVKRIIVYSSSRLSRRPRDWEDAIDWSEKHGVQIVSVATGANDPDLSTAQGRFQARVLAAADANEAEQNSERTKRAHQAIAEQGKPSGGGARPFGYGADGVTVREDEAAVIRDIAEWLLDGDSLTSVARRLNEQGWTTTVGKPWTRDSIRKMLTSPRIAGLRGHNGDIYPAVWRGILDVDTWEALRERLSRNGGGTNQVRHPFTGLVRCERCGASMTIKRASGKPRYACPTREGGRGCGSIAIRQDELDALLTETLLRQVEDVDLGDADQGDDAALLADEIARLEAKLAALAEVFAEDGLSAVEYRAAARKVRTKIEAAQADLARRSRRRAIMPEVSVLRRDWLAGSLSIRDRRELARTFIDRVEIGPARRGYNRFDPSRVTLHWR